MNWDAIEAQWNADASAPARLQLLTCVAASVVGADGYSVGSHGDCRCRWCEDLRKLIDASHPDFIGEREFDPLLNCPTHFVAGNRTCPACVSKQHPDVQARLAASPEERPTGDKLTEHDRAWVEKARAIIQARSDAGTLGDVNWEDGCTFVALFSMIDHRLAPRPTSERPAK